MINRILLSAGLAGVLCASAWAQKNAQFEVGIGQDADTSRWIGVMQVAAGRIVQVHLNSGRTVNGKLIRGDGTNMVLQNSKEETMIARAEIREVRLREGRGRGGRAKLGAIIGVSIGGGLGTLGSIPYVNAGEPGLAVAGAALSAGLGAGIGAGIGAAIPDRYTRVYSAAADGSKPQPAQ